MRKHPRISNASRKITVVKGM